MLPPRINWSTTWDHFIVESGVEKKARCNYCGDIIKYKDGTSGMKNHLKRCKQNPYKDGNKRLRTDCSSSQTVEGKVGGGVGSSPTYFKFDQELCQTKLVKMFVIAELPFRFVENEAFCKFLAVLQPRFSVPSRSTLTHDIYTLFNEEKERLKKILGKHCGRVTGCRFDEKSELYKHLKEDVEPFNNFVEFDILNWWRVNSARFPILGKMTPPPEGTSSAAIDLD
ncbi:Zinc finger, BED-type [Sesbania bispinosa]|nr:Zinc finger, BED-type [Sesbania bispinosa]